MAAPIIPIPGDTVTVIATVHEDRGYNVTLVRQELDCISTFDVLVLSGITTTGDSRGQRGLAMVRRAHAEVDARFRSPRRRSGPHAVVAPALVNTSTADLGGGTARAVIPESQTPRLTPTGAPRSRSRSHDRS